MMYTRCEQCGYDQAIVRYARRGDHALTKVTCAACGLQIIDDVGPWITLPRSGVITSIEPAPLEEPDDACP